MLSEETKNKLAILNGQTEERYHELIREKIRARYSVYDEIAILRQRDSKPEEFAEYDAFVEQCKQEARTIMGI